MSALFDSKAATVKIQDVYSIVKVIIASVKMKKLHGVIILKTDEDVKHAYKYGDKYLIVLFNNNENTDALIKLKEECLRHGIEYIEL